MLCGTKQIGKKEVNFFFKKGSQVPSTVFSTSCFIVEMYMYDTQENCFGHSFSFHSSHDFFKAATHQLRGMCLVI